MPVIPQIQKDGKFTIEFEDNKLENYYKNSEGVKFRENIMKFFPGMNFKKHVFPHLDKYTYNSIIPEKIQSQISNELVLEKRYRLEFLKKKHGGKLIFAIMTACLITITIPKWLLIRYRDKERKKFKFEERLKEEEVYETLPNVKRTREEQEKWYQKNNEEE